MKKHPTRLKQLYKTQPSYFLTFCTEERVRVLAVPAIAERMRIFSEGSADRYGLFVYCYLLMPDHVHLIVTVALSAEVRLGEWVKALKRFVSECEFKWQRGFFDHVLRNDESRSQKWEYIRMNPVRAGLVEQPEDWPYSGFYNPLTGARM
jgi:putative transposase